jgi:hypothetical protein
MVSDPRAANHFEQEAARHLADALAVVARSRGRVARERHRALLDRAIGHAESAIATAGGAAASRAYAILARAHAARADDARHGAGQLSLSAQRAPTADACDEGWRRVEGLVHVAENAGVRAAEAAACVGDSSPGAHAALAASARAAASARDARRIVEERNRAFTFHTDPGFSFGEGWHLAAAAVLAGIEVQVEPDTPGTTRAERFLRDAGLGEQLVPYRPRPRAAKQTTELVARELRRDAADAQRKLRAAFLGDRAAEAVDRWLDAKLTSRRSDPKLLLWIRRSAHHPGRNSTPGEIRELALSARRAGLAVVLVGDALPGDGIEAAIDLTLFWKAPLYSDEDGRTAQLWLFEHLRGKHGVRGQVGVTTAGMDGPALLGMPTVYLTDATNPRMSAWVDAVPGYREVVRNPGYLDEVRGILRAWL